MLFDLSGHNHIGGGGACRVQGGRQPDEHHQLKGENQCLPSEPDTPVKNSLSKIFPLEEMEFSLSSKNHFKFPKEFERCPVKFPATGLKRQAHGGEQRAHDARRAGRDVAAGEELGGEGEEGDDGRCKAC